MAVCEAGGALAALPWMGSVLNMLSPDFQGVLQDAFFYCSVREYVMNDIIQGPYQALVAAKLAMALGVMSATLMTIWVAFQGFQIITGANKNPIVPLFIQTGKMVLILSLVSLIAAKSPVIVTSVGDFKELVSESVAEGADITTLIDLNLGISALLNAITEAMKGVDPTKDPNVLTTTVGLLGQSGPAMLTGVLLMLAELSITFAIMLSPLFIFFLLFQQTSALFWSWAKFTLGALFSLATLTLIGSLALKATAVYGGMVVAAYYTNSGGGLGGLINTATGGPFDISGSSMRLAALGTLMSAIIIAIPPTIMQFFSSGASFAAGAFGFAGAGALAAAGRSGSSATGGAAAGLMNAGQGGAGAKSNQAPSGAAGTPMNLGYTGGESNMAAANNQSLLAKANSGSAGLDPDGASCTPGGFKGLANNPSENLGLAGIKHKQDTDEFHTDTSGQRTEAKHVQPSSQTTQTFQDAKIIKEYPHLGTGGTLKVSGGVTGNTGNTERPAPAGNSGETHAQRSSPSAPTSNPGPKPRPGVPYGQGKG
ncbi:type IV secretion system protein [Hydrogenophaga sp. PAMC20947]|uniref:type IV secretion system protein n=1 Tax=Hydrogenophaga sp. PAMC20947 TaxID=2565558 RepID=UPI00109DF244|nr:type IV secretion system protein [Hydrogenophaga sp. PAMC20947]QCB47451.1 type IV secretion system protein [Hydrogenophaga sp. PAMC20947]